MKIHKDFKPSMEKVANSLYWKLGPCFCNDKCGKQMSIDLTHDELILLYWLLRDFAKENGFEVDE